VLAQSTNNQFDIQARTSARGNVAEVTEAAARLCNHDVIFGAAGSFVRINGAPTLLSVASPNLAVGNCNITELSDGAYQATWNTGEVLDVTNTGTHLNLSSWLSPDEAPGSVEGLLVSDVNPDVWRVTGAASLFSAVPEPATLYLLAAGMGLILLANRRGCATSSKPH
jgi:PEP-CTERM motif